MSEKAWAGHRGVSMRWMLRFARSTRSGLASPLDDERAQDGRRELAHPLDPDPSQVGLEAVEVVAVGLHRLRAETAFVDQIVEEPENDAGERLRAMSAAGGLKVRQHQRETRGPQT